MTNQGRRQEYLTPHEVAELLLVSPVTVRQWAQKGQLRAETTPGGHRRFSQAEVERFAVQRGIRLERGGREQLRVLIVDDDKQLAGYLVELLDTLSDNVATDTAYDGFEAGQKVRTFVPHVVLLDLMMPGIDGLSVCRLLKGDPATRSIRIIAMTGYYSKENVERILAAGAEVCLAKPLDTAALTQAIGLNEPAPVATLG